MRRLNPRPPTFLGQSTSRVGIYTLEVELRRIGAGVTAFGRVRGRRGVISAEFLSEDERRIAIARVREALGRVADIDGEPTIDGMVLARGRRRAA